MTPLAWTIAVAVCAIAALLDWRRRRERVRLSTSDWCAGMRVLDAKMPLKPPKRTYEGAPGVCSTEKPKRVKAIQLVKRSGTK